MKWVVEKVSRAGGYLLGRRTYEVFAAHWPKASPKEQELALPLNTKPKHVASRTLSEPLTWENSTLLKGSVAESVAKLKREGGGDLFLIGSTELVAALLARRPPEIRPDGSTQGVSWSAIGQYFAYGPVRHRPKSPKREKKSSNSNSLMKFVTLNLRLP